jgi:hypothetical protein
MVIIIIIIIIIMLKISVNFIFCYLCSTDYIYYDEMKLEAFGLKLLVQNEKNATNNRQYVLENLSDNMSRLVFRQ